MYHYLQVEAWVQITFWTYGGGWADTCILAMHVYLCTPLNRESYCPFYRSKFVYLGKKGCLLAMTGS